MKKTILIAALVAAFVGVGTSVATSMLMKEKTSEQKLNYFTQQKNNTNSVRWANLSTEGQPVDFTYAAEQSVHAVVHVKTTYKSNQTTQKPSQREQDLFDFFFGDPFGGNGGGSPYEYYNQQPKAASGSGVIISADGYIITNNHVIEKANEIEVTLNNKQTFKAKVIGADPATDIALIKIEATDLPYLTFGNSDNVKVGEWVLAVGNPLELTSTVTAGIVSAKARNLGIISRSNKMGIESFIQTDAAINPGNSGGALVNTRGELIGINSVIASPTGSYAGYGFAVPSQIAQKVVEDLKEYGVVQRAMLGVSMADLNQESAEKFGLKTNNNYKGVIVAEVLDNSSAKIAGIEKNDIITSVNGVETNSPSDIQEQIARYRPNDKIEISAIRDGKMKHFDVVLRNKAGGVNIVKNEDNVFDSLGATLKEVSKDELKNLSISRGIKVTDIRKGKLQEAGVKNNFIIVSANKQPVSSIEDLKEIFNDTTGGILLEGVYPNGLFGYYVVRPEKDGGLAE